MISEIKEQKGKQNFFTGQNKSKLDKLVEIAKIQSTEASNKIEGIVTIEKRLGELFNQKTTPKNRDEEEIMGYRDVLNTIHENFEFISVKPNYILKLIAGVDLKTVSARAGHSKASTTSDFYSHYIRNSDMHASEIINKLFE